MRQFGDDKTKPFAVLSAINACGLRLNFLYFTRFRTIQIGATIDTFGERIQGDASRS
jgi:hypothetical protein